MVCIEPRKQGVKRQERIKKKLQESFVKSS